MITIPKQHYVGLKPQKDNIPLAFLTPFGSDAAFRKRKETVDSWADHVYGDYDPETKKTSKPKTIPSKVVDNEPLKGYAIAEEVRRYGWGSGNVVWRMIDPRGFEFEISSPNLARILDCCTVINGVIQDACLFGREGAQNVLLPISSEPYKLANTNTVRASKKISLKDVKIGDRIHLKDGRKAFYLGQYKIATQKHEKNRNALRGEPSVINLLTLKNRHLILAEIEENQNAKSDWEKFEYSHRLGRQYKTGELVVFGYEDLHVSEILETNNSKYDKYKFVYMPENMDDEAYAILDKSTKITDLKLEFQEVALELHESKSKRYYRRGFLFHGIPDTISTVDAHSMSSQNEDLRYTRTPCTVDLVTNKLQYRYTNNKVNYTRNEIASMKLFKLYLIHNGKSFSI